MNNPNNNIDNNNPTKKFEQEVVNIIKNNNYKLTADKITTILKTIKNNKNISSRRWVWELMQNATDVRYDNEKISVEIILNKDKLEFKHNGKYFKINNILAIVQQVSSKNSLNLEGQTGKFGTGFIGTHLLSDIIDIKGILEINENDFREFQIRLDRSEKSSEQLAKNIEKSIEIFFNINNKKDIFKVKPNYLQKRKEEDYDTCFTYYLNDEEKKKSAIEGLNDLINTMPTTLITQYKKINQVTIIDNIQQIKTTYTSNIIGNEIKNGITESYVKIITDNKGKKETIEELYFLSYLKVNEETNKEILRLIIQIEKQNGIIVLLKRDINKPVLYRNFPLIGSNDFYMPFIVDGFDFNPLEARNGLFLNGIDNKNNTDSNDNVKILDEAYQTSLTFINCILTKYKNIMNRFILASSKMPKPIYPFDNYTKDWFYEKQKEYRQGLREMRLLKFGDYHKFDKLILPIFKENYNIDFFNVVNNLNIRKKILPQQEDYKNWYDIIINENIEAPGIELKKNEFITSWGYTMNKENSINEINYIYDEINLLKDLSDCKNINNLENKLKKKKSEIIDYLNEFLQFFKNNWNDEDILNTYPILPNRNGDFKKIKDLYSDSSNIIPKPIMDIYNSISTKKLNEELIDSEINIEYLGDVLKIKDFTTISSYLNKYIKNNENIESIKKLVVYPLLSIKTDKKEIIEIYNFLTKFIKLDQKEINTDNKTHIPINLWTQALDFWYIEHPKEIEKYNNIKGFHNNLINKNITEDDILKLINDYLAFLVSNSTNRNFVNLKIFPNQNGDFCALNSLHFDSGFPDEFKDILKKYFNIDKRNILLSKEIVTYKEHKIMQENEITEEIIKEFNNLKLTNINKNKLKDIALEILCLYPENKEKETIREYNEKIISPRKPGITYDNSINNLGFAEIVFNKKDKYDIKYIKTNSLRYIVFINYIMEILCDEIENAGTFGNIKNRFYGINNLTDLEEFLTNIIKFIWDSENTEYSLKNCIQNKKVFLNMNNNLLSIKEVKIKENFEIEENDEKILLNICLNKHININYRNVLLNKKLEKNLENFKDKFRTNSLKEVCKEIDDKIMEYDQKYYNHDIIYDKDFYDIIKGIRKLKIGNEKVQELFKYYWKHKKQICISCINDEDAETLFTFANKGQIKSYDTFLQLFSNNQIEILKQYLEKCGGNIELFLSCFKIKSGPKRNLKVNQEFKFKTKLLDENKSKEIIINKPLIIDPESVLSSDDCLRFDNTIEFILEESLDLSNKKKEIKINYI